MALNKWDLIDDPNATMAEIRRRAHRPARRRQGRALRPALGLTGRNVDKLLPAVVAAHARWDRRVPTAALNRWLAEALERHPPPLAQGRRVKIRYATQATARPPTFILFANKPAEALPESYLRYLATGLREAFDLWGVPIRFHVRHGENPYDAAERPARSRRGACSRQQELDQGRRRRAPASAACPAARPDRPAAQPGRHRPGIEQVDPDRRDPQLGRVGQDQRLQRRLARGVGAPIGAPRPGAAVGDEHRPARRGRAQQRVEAADQALVGDQVHRQDPLERLGLEVAHRRDRPQLGGAGDEPVEAAEALEQRGAQRVDQLALGQVERHQRSPRRRPAADGVVDLLQRTAGARHQDEPGPLGGAGLRHGGTQAARGAGDQHHPAGEASPGHAQASSSRSVSWRPPSSPSMSASRVG